MLDDLGGKISACCNFCHSLDSVLGVSGKEVNLSELRCNSAFGRKGGARDADHLLQVPCAMT
jgi:hypothetical protein